LKKREGDEYKGAALQTGEREREGKPADVHLSIREDLIGMTAPHLFFSDECFRQIPEFLKKTEKSRIIICITKKCGIYIYYWYEYHLIIGGKNMRARKSLQTGRQTNRIMPAVFRYRMLITFFVLLLAAGVFCGSVSAYDEIHYAQNLSDALNLTTDSGVGAAYVNEQGEVVLLQDVQLHYTINIQASDSITLTANESNDFTIYRDFTGECLFNVIEGEFIMEGNNGHNLTIDGNITTYSGDNGASLICVDGGIFTMSDGAVLQNSTTSSSGGGVYVDGGTFTMTGGNISDNTATYGGGVFVTGGTFNMTGGSITDNTANSTSGGVFVNNTGTFTMNGGNISGNTAPTSGGVFVYNLGTFTMTGGNIFNNTAKSNGGGVFVNGGTFTMNGGNITDNTAKSNGGGVFADSRGTFTMNGGNISGNTAGARGGGVCMFGSTFTMNGDSIISGNTAATSGGGVLVYNGGTFTMNGDSIISGNTASTNGGGVCVYGSGTFNMTGGDISDNNAETDGGGVYVYYGGTFNMTGGDISDNNADSRNGGWGGGVCVYNTGTFNMTGGDISSNNASGWGGGVYVDSSTFTMTCGNISDNTARVQGNGVYVFNGMFTMIGGNISSNNASTDGGGVFVDRFGTFTMNCSAAVNTNNDVYLNSSRFITVTGVLSSTAGTRNITPEFTSGTVIRYNAGVSPGTWTDNFALNQTWANDHPTLALGQSGSDILLGTNCTVTFWINSTTVYLSQYNVSGALLAQPADPSSSGYTFGGWNISSASGDPWDFTNDTITANLDLYAKWTPNFAPISPGSGGDNSNNNVDSGSLSAGGAFTTNDGGLTLQYPAGTSAIITIFPNYLCGGISLPPNVSYLNLYDVYSTAQPGTPVTLVFNVDVLQLDELGVTSEDCTILHYYDGEWHPVGGSYNEEDHTIMVIRTHLSPFMVAYNIDESLFPLEGAAASTSTPTTGPTQVEPTVVVPTTAPTKAASSPVPVLGIIAGVAGMALLIRRE